MAFMGIETARPTRWIRDNWVAFPSIFTLITVTACWVVGAAIGIDYLTDASSPMAMLTGLYIGLAAVAVSIIATTLALNHLISRYSRPRTRR